MNKVKTFFWIILVAFVLILFFSNLDFFLQSQRISFNFILKTYTSPALPNGALFLIFFAAGLLVAYFSNLPERFRLKKTIKKLKATIDTHEKEIGTATAQLQPPGASSTLDTPSAGESS